MANPLFSDLEFRGQALALRSERQSVLASNIANVDTPNYKARDFDFGAALSKATGRNVSGTAGNAAMSGAGAGAGSEAGLDAGGGSSGIAPAATLAMAASSGGGGGGGGSAGVSGVRLAASDPRHFGVSNDGSQTWSTRDVEMAYRLPDQASLDGNTVELDRERANFADNAVRYQATVRFLDSGVRSMLSAIKGNGS